MTDPARFPHLMVPRPQDIAPVSVAGFDTRLTDSRLVVGRAVFSESARIANKGLRERQATRRNVLTKLLPMKFAKPVVPLNLNDFISVDIDTWLGTAARILGYTGDPLGIISHD